MKVLRNGTGLKRIASPVVTLGNFDGIHLGHRSILKRLCTRARALGCPSVVYTFEPHPLKVVAPSKSPPLILDTKDKLSLIEGFGIDFLVLARFTERFASTHPRQFVEDVLVKGLGAREVLVGLNFSFGKGRTGNVDYLKGLGLELGFRVSVAVPVKRGGAVVSSSRIRALVLDGELAGAGALLGRPYSIKGSVKKGAKLGRGIGFPTANLEVQSELTPGSGVYAARVKLGRRVLNALVNIGIAPTFARGSKCVEVHLLDFKGDIYGRPMKVAFLKRLRDEMRFATGEALARQIRKDSARAEKIFAALKPPPLKKGANPRSFTWI